MTSSRESWLGLSFAKTVAGRRPCRQADGVTTMILLSHAGFQAQSLRAHTWPDIKTESRVVGTRQAARRS